MRNRILGGSSVQPLTTEGSPHVGAAVLHTALPNRVVQALRNTGTVLTSCE